jgi:hypothetical protein
MEADLESGSAIGPKRSSGSRSFSRELLRERPWQHELGRVDRPGPRHDAIEGVRHEGDDRVLDPMMARPVLRSYQTRLRSSVAKASWTMRLPDRSSVSRDNLDENGASIWMRRGGRAERQLTMAVVLARL